MTLPIVTTWVSIERLSENVDPYADATTTVVDSSASAVISGSTGRGSDIGGAQQVLEAKLFVNPETDVRKADYVTDLRTSERWKVLWVRARTELGLGHKVAGLEIVEGAVV